MDSDGATDSIFLAGEEIVMESTSTQADSFMMEDNAILWSSPLPGEAMDTSVSHSSCEMTSTCSDILHIEDEGTESVSNTYYM